MAGFGRDMRGQRMREPAGSSLASGAAAAVQTKPSSSTGMPCWRAASVAPKIAASSRPPTRGSDLQRIGKRRAMMRSSAGVDRRGLALQAGIVDAGAAPDPVAACAAEQCRRDRCRRRGVADAHLAEAEQVGILGDRVIAGRHGGEEIRLVHRRRYA